jgi:hypothetical protein
MADAMVLENLALPAEVEQINRKTAIIFKRNNKKAILKGRALELTSCLKELGDRVRKYTETEIEKCHLGSVQGVITGVKDCVDLNKILKVYFKQTKKSSKA